jgi:hypothetical protein
MSPLDALGLAGQLGVDLVLPRLARENEAMGRRPTIVLFVLALIAVVVGVDVLFFRHHFWERLITNVGIVLIFAAVYFRFLQRL